MEPQTTHHKTGTVFQECFPNDDTHIHHFEPTLPYMDKKQIDYGSYKIPKHKIYPPSFPEFYNTYSDSDLLKQALECDIRR